MSKILAKHVQVHKAKPVSVFYFLSPQCPHFNDCMTSLNLIVLLPSWMIPQRKGSKVHNTSECIGPPKIPSGTIFCHINDRCVVL